MNSKNAVHETGTISHGTLADGYRQMAADIEHELEADEWTEALVGDILEVNRGPVSGSTCCRSTH